MTEAPKPPATPRHAATVVLVRPDGPHWRVLMGQRGKGASFMPSKFVFPGGALDAEDQAFAGQLRDAPGLAPACATRLDKMADPGLGPALGLAAIRETFEETGLIFGHDRPATVEGAPPENWADYHARGVTPALDRLTFIFRAITPEYRPKRFDARFFLARSTGLLNDPDDFSAASGELAHLSWLTIPEARKLELPLITEVVLAEVEEILAVDPEGGKVDRPAPFFHHAGEVSSFDAL